MSSSEPAGRVGLYVRAPVYVRSSVELELARFDATGQPARRVTLGVDETRIAAGIYRVDAGPGRAVTVTCDGEGIEAVSVADGEPWPELPPQLHSVFGELVSDQVEQFFAPAERSRAGEGGRGTDGQLAATLSVHARPRPQHRPLSIACDDDVRITVHESCGRVAASAEGVVDAELAPGLYRVHYERCGTAVEEVVDHVQHTVLRHAGPPLITPALLASAATTHDYYTAAVRRLSVEDTYSPLGAAPHSSRLFVFVRRERFDVGPAHVPSEPLAVHDLYGHCIVKLDRTTCEADDVYGYIAFSARVAPGTYRLRAGWSPRDVAITIPAGRAAQVFIAERGSPAKDTRRGTLALDDLRVALVPVDQPFDPRRRSDRAMESAIFALRALDSSPPLLIRRLPLEAIDENLCIGIVKAHLALRSGDRAGFLALVERLARYADLPDVAILDQVAGGAYFTINPGGLAAPPLLRASLALALSHPSFDGIDAASHGAAAQAASATFNDSVWCTWSAASWNSRWIEPTVALVRDREPDLDAAAIAKRVSLPRRIVERVLARPDTALSRLDLLEARGEQGLSAGYRKYQYLRQGAHGVVYLAEREDGRPVALKLVPLIASADIDALIGELRGAPHVAHAGIVPYTDCRALAGGAGLCLEMEPCTGSLLDTLGERGKPLDVHEAIRAVLEALDGLAALHALGRTHGDVKPSNLLVRSSGPAPAPPRVALGDVGFTTRLVDAHRWTGRSRAPDSIRFAAPGQLTVLREPCAASDVWSMAATLYFLLCLEPPREHYTDQTELEAASRNPTVSIGERRPDLSRPIIACIDRALSFDAADRPRDASELASQLRAAVALVEPPENEPAGPGLMGFELRRRLLARAASTAVAATVPPAAGPIAPSVVATAPPQPYIPPSADAAASRETAAATTVAYAAAFRGLSAPPLSTTSDPAPVPPRAGLAEAQPVLEHLCRWLREWLDRTYCRILVADMRVEEFRVAAACAAPRRDRLAWAPYAQERTAITELPEAYLAPDAIVLGGAALRAASPFFHPVEVRDLKELLIIPILVDDQVIGMLDLGECRDRRGIASQHSGPERRRPRSLAAGDRPEDVLELAREAARVAAQVLESERKRQMLGALDAVVQELQPEPATLWREVARLAAELLGARIGAVYVCDPDSDELVLEAHGGDRRVAGHLVKSCPRDAGFLGGLQGAAGPDRAWRRWPTDDAAGAPFTPDAPLTTALAVALRGAGIEAVLLVADAAPRRRFTATDVDVLERFERHASAACRRMHTSPESQVIGRVDILRQIHEYARTADSLDRVLHALLTGITAGYGLRFNRAALFLYDEAGTALVGKMAIGNTTWEDASADWQRDRQRGPQDFAEYLRAVQHAPMPETRLHRAVAGLSIPLTGDGDVLSSALELPRRLLSSWESGRLPEPLRGVLDPDPQTEIVLVRVMATRCLGLIIADNRFTKHPIGREALESLVTFARATALAIEGFPERGDNHQVDEAIRTLAERSADAAVAAVQRRILDQAVRVCGAALGVLWPYDPDSLQFEPPIAINVGPQFEKDLSEREPRRGGITSKVLDEHHVVVEDIATSPLLDQEIRQMLAAWRIRSFQGIALVAGTEPLGVLYVDYPEPRQFTDRDQRVLARFAMPAALALQRARVSRRVQAAQHRVEAMADLEPLSYLERTFEDVATRTKDVLGCDVVTLHVYNESTSAFERPPRHAGQLVDQKALHKVPEGLSPLPHWVMEQPEPILVEDIATHLKFRVARFARVERIQSCLALPLRAFGRPVGALFANFHDRRVFSGELRTRARQLADEVAIAIGNALRLRENDVLASVTRELMHTSSPQETLHAIARMPATLLGGRAPAPVVTRVILREGSDLVVAMVDGGGTGGIGAVRAANRGSLAGFAADAVEPVVSSLDTESRFIVGDDRRHFRSAMAVRMIAGNQLVGVLEIVSKKANHFSNAQSHLVSTIAAHAAMAIKSDQRHTEVLRGRGHLEALREAELGAEQMRRGAKTRDEVLDDLLRITVECFRRYSLDATANTVGTLFLVRPGEKLALHGAYPKALEDRYARERSLRIPPIGVTGRAVVSGEPQLALDLPHGHKDHLAVIEGTRSEIAAPIVWCGNIVGVLDVESDSRWAFDETDRSALVTLAGFVAIALGNHGIAHIVRAASELRTLIASSRDSWRRALSRPDKPTRVELIGRRWHQLREFDAQYSLIEDITAAAMAVNAEPLNAESTELKELIDSAVKGLRETAADRSVQIDSTITPEAPVTLWVDQARMQHVLTNVLANAINHTRGNVQVEATREADDDRIVVAVGDEHRERPPVDDLKGLFDPYHGSQGLRLSVAKTFVEAHGGHIWAQPNSRGGLTILFDLDASGRPPSARGSSPDQVPAARSSRW